MTLRTVTKQRLLCEEVELFAYPLHPSPRCKRKCPEHLDAEMRVSKPPLPSGIHNGLDNIYSTWFF